jgi:DNA repair protein RecN (Recombination protein N)
MTIIKSFLTDNGLADDEDILVISCEIRRKKPDIVRINGRTVTKTILRQAGQMIVDIHGQSDHLSLLDKRSHLEFLDAYAHNHDLKHQFSAKVNQLHKIEDEHKALESQAKDNIRQEEFLKYQIDEIRRAKLREGEDEELEKERHIISFSEKLKIYSTQVYQALSESSSERYSTSALVKLSESLQAMRKLVELDSSQSPQLDILENIIYGLEEISRDIHIYNENLENDPARLEEIESRLEIIRNLKRKYGKTIEEILDYLNKSEKELSGISKSSEKQIELAQQAAILRTEMGELAFKLSQSRSQSAQQLMINVKKELQDLEMSQMQFEVTIKQIQSTDGITGPNGISYVFDNNGIDNVEFLVSTNPGEPPKPLVKIASTGEISRFTLALKGALSETDNIPVLVFDEIDIGVGGRSGDIIGKKLCNLSKHHQVICVTHLPQIAAYADAHYYIRKETTGPRITSTLENLDNNLRLRELAIMMSGANCTDAALKSADELLHRAAQWKKMFSD